MGITVYFGKRKGSASTADLSARAVAETVEKACDIARYTAEDECAGLADPEELARDIPDLDLDPSLGDSPERRVRDGARLRGGRLARSIRASRNSEGASVGSHAGVRVYGNSHGFLAGYPVDQPQRELRAARAEPATTCSATTGTHRRATARDLEDGVEHRRKAGERARGAARCAQDRDPEGARAVRAGSRRAV